MQVFEKIKISNEMVVRFSELSGDKNPIHLNEDYAKKSVFGRRIVHGMLLSSFFSKLIAEKYPGSGSIYLAQNLNFKKPCYIDDEVLVVIKLINSFNGKYELKTTIYRGDDEIIDGSAVVLKR